MADIRNYWSMSPLGGRNDVVMNGIPAGARNIDGKLVPVTTSRVRQDPFTWKAALQEAEIPLPLLAYRVKLQQMYMDTILDGHVFACMERRKDMVLLKDYGIFDAKGNQDDAATEIVNQIWYKEIMSHALDANYFGYTLLGIGDIVDGKPSEINLIRRPNISPDRLNIAQVPYSPSGINFMDENAVDDEGISYKDWTIWIPTKSDLGISKCGYGLLYKISLYQILLRNNLGDNATFNELFGQPLRVGKTNKKDLNARNQLRNELDSMGSTAWALLDEEDKIEFINQQTGAGAANGPYDNLEQRLEKKISKIILGHSDALDSTSGKLGDTGKDDDGAGKAVLDKEKKDTDFLETVMNDIVNPKLMKLGIKIPVGKKLRFKNDKEKQEITNKKNANSKMLADIALTFKNAGLSVDAKQFEEATGLKLTPIVESSPMINNPNLSKEVKNKLEGLYK